MSIALLTLRISHVNLLLEILETLNSCHIGNKEIQMRIVPTLVMPAIYSFPQVESVSLRKLGWHKVSELVEAVNHIRQSQEECPLTQIAIANEFAYTGTNEIFREDAELRTPPVNTSWCFKVINPSESIPRYELVSRRWAMDSHWLSAAEDDSFYPEKLGKKLIKAVKKQKSHIIRKVVKFMIKH